MRWKFLKIFAVVGIAAFFLIPLLDQVVIGFRYPVAIDNDPLLNPVRVESVAGHTIILEDGRAFEIEWLSSEWQKIFAKELKEGTLTVDLDRQGVNSPMIFAKYPQTICGTSYGRMINIRLFADEIPRYRRLFVGSATRVKPPKATQ